MDVHETVESLIQQAESFHAGQPPSSGIIMTHGDRKVLPQGNKKGIMYGRGMLSPKDMKPRCYIRESIAVRVMEAK